MPATTSEVQLTSTPHAQSTRPADERSNVFICFAPEERDFARDLDNELRKRRRISAIDWEKADAAATSAGPDVLQKIEAADTFVFIVSPSSAASEVCRKQLEHAARLSKVIVPVVRAEVAAQNLPAALAPLTPIDYRAEVNREEAFEQVIRAVNTNLSIDIFICYSRADKVFVKKLYDELRSIGRSVWLDLSSIPTSAIWEQEIYLGIEAADNFLFVISPDSLRPDSFCHNEFDYARNNNKRIIALNYRAAEPSSIPWALGQYQWREFSAGSDFATNFGALVKDLEKDPKYLRPHTRLLTRAKEWERSGGDEDIRDASLLLRGTDLTRAEELLRIADKELQFTDLQKLYVAASRASANRSRNWRFIAVTTALAIVTALAIFLFFEVKKANAATKDAEDQTIEAKRQTTIAETQRVAAISATVEAKLQQANAEVLRWFAQVRAREALAAAEAERVARDQAEERRLEAERERKRADEKAEAERKAREAAEIRGLRAEAGVFEATGKPLDALALHRAANELEQSAGRRASFNDIERLAKKTPLSRLSAFHQDGVIDNLAVSLDGTTLATAGRRGDIFLWDATTGTTIKTLPASAQQMSSLVFSPVNRNLLVSVSTDKDDKHLATLWHVETGDARVIELKGGRFTSNSVSMSDRSSRFSDDGQLLLVGSVVINAETGSAVEMSINGRAVTASALSHKKNLVLLTFDRKAGGAPDSSMAALYDAATGQFLRPLLGTTPAQGEVADSFRAVAFSHDDSYVAAATFGNKLRIWKVADGQPVEVAPTKAAVQHLAFSPNNNSLVTTDSFYRLGKPSGPWEKPSTISVWNAATGALVKEQLRAHDDNATSLLFSDDGERLATSSFDGMATIWDAREWVPLQTLESHKCMVNSLAFIPGSHDLVTASDDGTTRVWHYIDRFQTYQLEATEADRSFNRSNIAAFSPDGTRAVREVFRRVEGKSEHVGTAIYDTQTRQLRELVKNSANSFAAVAFSDDATRIAKLFNDGSIKVWEVSSGRHIGPLEDRPTAAGISPRASYSSDLLTVAQASQQQVTVTDLNDNHPLLSFQVKGFQGMTGAFRAVTVALSPDGMWFAAAFDTGPEINGKRGQGKGILWKRSAGQFVLQKSFDIAPNGRMTFTHDAKLLIMSDRDGGLSVLDTGTLELGSLPAGHRSCSVDFIICAREAPVCATASWYDKTVKIWRAAPDFALIASIESGGPVRDIALSADGSRLITMPKRRKEAVNILRVWDTSNGDLKDSIEVNRWSGSAPTFFPNSGRIILADSTTNEFNIWDTHPFGQGILYGIGSRINLRVCRETHKVVTVLPFPPQDTVWAPPELCQ